MLPSTGYFKSINCPFYENSFCERPYCHFKHLKKENVSNISTEGPNININDDKSNKKENKQAVTTSTVASPNSEMIQQLVTDAVNIVLADQCVSDKEKVSENIVNKVVEGLKPTLATTITPTIGRHVGVPQLIAKPSCVYNPTPIAELKKRHISVPVYTPTRDNKIAVKRKSNDESTSISSSSNSTKITEPWSNHSSEGINNSTKELLYKPTAITNYSINKDIQSYIPTVKVDNNLTSINENFLKKEIYYPKSKKRREEYVPKMIKAPLQLNEINLDQLEPEFNTLNNVLISTKISKNNIKDSNDSDIEAKFSEDDDNKDLSDNGGDGGNDDDTSKINIYSTKDIQDKKIHSKNNKNEYEIVFNENEKNNDDLHKANNNNNNNNSNTNKLIDKKSNFSEKKNDEHENNNIISKIEDKKKRKSDDKSKRSSSSNKHHSSSSKKYSEKNDQKHSRSNSSHSTINNNNNNNNNNSSSSSSSRSRSRNNSSNSKSLRSHRDKHSSSKENDRSHKKSSRQDKYKSSQSKDIKRSSSSRENKHSRRKSIERKSNYEKSESDYKDILLNEYINEEDLLSTDSERDVEEECLKIFQEYKAVDCPKEVVTTKNNELEKIKKEDIEEIGKKRTAHPSADSSIRSISLNQPPRKIQNPQQRMYERWRLMREAASEIAAEKNAKSKFKTDTDIGINETTTIIDLKSNKNNNKSEIHNNFEINNSGRIRIAPVSYAISLTMEKKKIMESISMSIPKSETKNTVAQTSKGSPRLAHIPQVVPQLIHPEPLAVSTQKFSINIRQYYVNLMHDCCIQIYPNGEDAAQRALREELACHEKCKALPVYKNSCMLAIHRLKKEIEQGSKDDNNLVPSGSGVISHDAILAGKSKGSWSIVKTKRTFTNFKGSALYSMLKKWIMTDQQLKDNGFPRPHPQGPKGRAKIYAICTRNHSILSKVPNERYCSRCSKAFLVDKFDFPLKQENCIYHWGRKITFRGESKYTCCQQDSSASGCSDGRNHVWDHVDLDNLRGFVQTLPKNIPPEDQGVYALDCEMCYTTQGLELTRVTVINEDCKVIYESLVKPENIIVDYNTRFSGITEENMAGVTTTLLEVQASLLAMFSDKTILIGHSLESDFKALKLIHNTVVDTSMVFPHKSGYPYKRALKNLCSEYLQKIIQNSVGGHDSNEDAISCMELMHWKVKEEAKLL